MPRTAPSAVVPAREAPGDLTPGGLAFRENMTCMGVTRESWIEAHPYLEPVARFEAALCELARALPVPSLPTPPWSAYGREFESGVPLLRSDAAGPTLLEGAAGSMAALVERAAGAPLPEPFLSAVGGIRDELRREPGNGLAALAWVSGRAPDGPGVCHPGALRLLGWTALAHALAPTLCAYAAWRAKQPWERGFCPTCGSRPALSHLAPGSGNAAKRRELLCACCGTRWPARRIGCPHCGSDDCRTLGVLEVEQEAGLRIDVCESCHGYLKTWVGEEEESPLLADWATLHLDALAVERGYRRMGDSLYEF
jgi:FdhE protein